MAGKKGVNPFAKMEKSPKDMAMDKKMMADMKKKKAKKKK